MKEVAELIYKLEGEAVEEGINVRDLAPILLSLGAMIEESNRILNPDGPQISVNVKPFQKGSFEVDIAVFFASNWQEIKSLLQSDNVQAVKELLEWLGLVGIPKSTAFGIGLIGLLRFLKGKPKKVEQLGTNQVRYTNQEGKSQVVNSQVHKLYNSGNIHITINQAIVEPLEKKGIEKLETYLKSDENKTKQEIKKDEVVEIKESLADGELIAHADDEITNQPVEMYLHPKKVDLEDDGKAWRFRKAGSKDEIIYAEIKDREFLKTPKTLSKNDLLKVKIVQKQRIQSGHITIHNEIIEVLEYKPSPKQQDLPFQEL